MVETIRRTRIAENLSATGEAFAFPGGPVSFECTATTWNGATAKVQKQSIFDASVFIDVDTTNFQATANKVYAQGKLPSGRYRLHITGSPTAVNSYLDQIPN